MRHRIAATAAVGLAAAALGIARLATMGWLLALALRGATLAELVTPALLAAALIVARGLAERWRASLAHATSAAVQMRLRLELYDSIVALGPAHFAGARTGGVMVTLVDGVTQLETYFGRYLPQLAVAALTILLTFAVTAAIDLPVALVLAGFALAALIAPAMFHGREGASLAHGRPTRPSARNSSTRCRACRP